MAETWRLIISPPLDGASNMALDHALARSAGSGDGPPTLRFYRWQPACLSLGYFQRLARDADPAACAAAGIDLVRRPTGGRAILHADEVTYSLAAPASQPGLGGRILDSYRTISSALLAGLRLLGVPAMWAASAAAGPHSAACFDTPGDYEITVEGRKLIGSAQTRTSQAILQHGTLLLSADVPLLHSLLRLPPELTAAALASRLVALDELLTPAPNWEAAVAALAAGFTESWGIHLEPGQPTERELALAAELLAQRYANPAWTGRR